MSSGNASAYCPMTDEQESPLLSKIVIMPAAILLWDSRRHN